MNPLTDIPIKAPPRDQRRRLGQWLREWEAEQVLRTAFPTSSRPSTRPGGSGLQANPHAGSVSSTPPSVGQVRLLYPVPTDSPAQRPLYVAVLAKQGNDAYLVAPFGRFAVPALPGEWRTHLRPLPLRVLCLWNARLIGSRLLESSWPGGTIGDQTIRRALEIHRHLRHGESLGTLADRDLGPPLQHPLDPRHVYLEQESALMDEHLALLQFGSGENFSSFPYRQNASPLPMAAEERAPYGSKRKRRRQGSAGPR